MVAQDPGLRGGDTADGCADMCPHDNVEQIPQTMASAGKPCMGFLCGIPIGYHLRTEAGEAWA